MIETARHPRLTAVILHRVAGTVDRQQAAEGAAEALRFVLQLSAAQGPVDLLLDLRGRQFENLQTHKAWSQGFVRNPALHGHVRLVAILDEDTPSLRAEQELMETERVRFFVDSEQAESWLEQA